MPILSFDTYDKLLKALVDSVGFTGFQISFDEFLSFPNLNLRYESETDLGLQQHPRWSTL